MRDEVDTGMKSPRIGVGVGVSGRAVAAKGWMGEACARARGDDMVLNIP